MSLQGSAALLVTVVILLGAAVAGAGAAFGAPDGYTARQEAGGDRLVRIDLATGVATPRDAVLSGITGVADLAFGRGKLWGVSVDNDLLVEIDPSDGSLESSVALTVPVTAAGITFTADGTLWMTATVASGVRLYRVDPATGKATEVGLLGTPGALDIGGLATTCDDEIFGIAGGIEVVRVDRSAPSVAPFLPAFSSGPQSLGIDPATETLWGLDSNAPGAATIWKVDDEDGRVTESGTTTETDAVLGLEIAGLPCGAAPAVALAPEPVLVEPNFTG